VGYERRFFGRRGRPPVIEEITDLLTSHPGRSFSALDITRRLARSRHAVDVALLELTARGTVEISVSLSRRWREYGVKLMRRPECGIRRCGRQHVS